MPLFLAILYPTTGLAVMLIGIFVYYQNKSNPSNRAFFALTLFQAIWICTLFFGYRFSYIRPADYEKSEFFIQLAYGAGPIMMLFLIIFLYYFPRIQIRFNKLLAWLYIGIMVGMSFISSFTNLIHDKQIIERGKYITDSFGPLYNLYSVLLLASLLLATFIATKKSFVLQGLEKTKVVYATVGCWLYGFVTILTNIILPLYHLTWLGNISVAEISPIYVMFFVLPTFYSIYKYRFFNFTYVSFKAFRTIILGGIIVLSTLGFFIVALNIIPNTSYLALLGISTFLAFLVLQRLQIYIPEFISGELREFKRVLTEFKTKILSIENLKNLQSAIENNFLVKLNFVNAKLYVLRKNGDNFDLPIYRRGSFTTILMDYQRDVLIKDEISFKKGGNTKKNTLLSVMTKLDSDMVVPLYSEKNLIGFLALKKKSSNAVYTREEIEEIEGFKKRLEVALMNSLLKLNLEEENNLMRKIIDQKTKQLKQKIAEVNELLKQQADFIAVTAHEFRTPLTIATFQIDNLLHSKPNTSAKSILKDLKLVESSINNVKTLTEKLFRVQQYDLNKVELHPEKMDITDFVEKLFKDFVPIMKKKGLHFEFKKGTKKKLVSKVDEAQFRQVLHNLLTNASKFTPKNGLVVLAIKEGKKKGNIELSVEDNGSGIPDDLKKSIFEKFRTKAVGAGLGLGLYLCKKIIALHKGKLWVEDSKLGGASFRISLKGA